MNLEYCLLSNNIYDYRIICQGKTTIPDVDDASEWKIIDVRYAFNSNHFNILSNMLIKITVKLITYYKAN